MTFWSFRPGPLDQFDRLRLVHFDHCDAVSINEAAFEPDVLTILSTEHLRSSEFSRSNEQKVHTGFGSRFVDLQDRERGFKKNAFEGPFDAELERAWVDGVLQLCGQQEKHRNPSKESDANHSQVSDETGWAL